MKCMQNFKEQKYFMTLDLQSRYFHITLAPEARAKTAFVTPFGKYEFNKVPFGLAQAPAYFQELICKVIGNIPYTMGYLDDNNFQQDRRRTLAAHSQYLRETAQSRTETKTIKMFILSKGVTILRASSI